MSSADPMRVILIGASVRPLIASCLQAACVPVAFDFFADWDSQRLIQNSSYASASLTKIERYEDLLGMDFSKLGDVAILFGGAELRSKLISLVSSQLPILGPGAESLAMISDPMQWLDALQTSGCRVPESRRILPAKAKTEDWLVKQIGTCGGSGVRTVDRTIDPCGDKFSSGDFYFQKRIAGQSWSAMFVSQREAKKHTSTTFLLGCTRQWLAADFDDDSDYSRAGGNWSRQTSGRCPDVPQILPSLATSQSLSSSSHGVRLFAYRGSVGPFAVCKSVQLQVKQIASLLGQKFSMQGVWGIDFVLDVEGQVWPVDFNPRITASAELFESAVARSGNQFRSVLDLHWSACRSTEASKNEAFDSLESELIASQRPKACETKRILFHRGPNTLEIDELKWKQLSRFYIPNFFRSHHTGASIADVPRIDDRIQTGRPILTIRSRAKSESAAMTLLNDLVNAVRDCVDGAD